MLDEAGEVHIQVAPEVWMRLAPYTAALDERSRKLTPAQLEALETTKGVYIFSPRIGEPLVDVYDRQYQKIGSISLEETKHLWAKCFVFKFQPRYFGEQGAFWVYDVNSREADQIRKRSASENETVTEGGEINAPS